MILWERDGWTLDRRKNFILAYKGKTKIVVPVDAWELYEMAITIKPEYAEINSIGQPIMRVAK
jgi:hypothetical protein